MPKVDRCVATTKRPKAFTSGSGLLSQSIPQYDGETPRPTQPVNPGSNSHSSVDQLSSSFMGSEVYWKYFEDPSDDFKAWEDDQLRQQNQMALTNISRAASDASTVTLTMPGSSLGKRKNSNLASIATVVSDVQADRYTRPKLNDKPPGLFRVVQDPNVHDESGTNKYLLPIIVAYSRNHQSFFEARNLSIGVQWEIARLITRGLSFDDIVINSLDKLKGTNSEAAPRVAEVLLPDFFSFASNTAGQQIFPNAFAREMAAKSPWAELDNEEAALAKDPLKGLGYQDSWYGGKVLFIGKLLDENTSYTSKDRQSGYRIILERPELGPSTRFARRFGSKRFLRIHIPQRTLHASDNQLMEYFSRPFIVLGRVFRAFFAKDHNVFLIETSECFRGDRIVPSSVEIMAADERIAFLDFVNWHNPMMSNRNQTAAKWAARFALGLSNSVPGLLLSMSDVHPIEDIISSSFTGSGKPPSETEMTDGCGFASASLLLRLREKFEWDNFPTAVQCRIGGAKGLILLHPSGRYINTDSEPQVWVRPSQTKIKYPSDFLADPSMLVVDVLRSSHLKHPARLSAETIVNLAENGVPEDVFSQLLKIGLSEMVSGLTHWEGEHAMMKLWYNVARVGGVMSARMARELGGESRAKGFGDRDDDSDDDDEDSLQINHAVHQRSTAWWADQISGCPSSLEETVMVLLDSGFTPKDCPVLAAKLQQVVKTAIKRYVIRYKINVPMSCEAFIVPDPFGVLQPGEVFIKSSRQLKGQDGLDTDVILGDVLVTRHPCKLPTDAQKVKAVFHEKLRQYTDVIIFSVMGDRSLASMLGGGDYDGDTVNLIWQPEIVSTFRNAPSFFATPPPDLGKSFSQNNETVAGMLERLEGSDVHRKTYEIQKFLLGALRNTSVVGTYSTYHDNAVYKLGYAHEETIRLAYMFCTCLDGSKTGQIVNQKTLQEDRDRYQHRAPAWKETSEDQDRNERFNERNLKRPSGLYEFIMDAIKKEAMKEENIHLCRYQSLLEANQAVLDKQLGSPWCSAQERAQQVQARTGQTGMLEELNAIAEHVHQIRARHRKDIGGMPRARGAPKSPKKGKRGVDFTLRKIEDRQDVLREISKDFALGPPDLLFFDEHTARRLKASYAYLHDWNMQEKKVVPWTRFPWDVAMRDLCEIKAKTLGLSKTITTAFYEVMTIHGHIRA